MSTEDNTPSLKDSFTLNAAAFGKLVDQIETRLKLLEEKEALLNGMEKAMQANAETAASKIVLDIGGKRFATSKSTLLKYKNTFFDAMLSSGHWKPDADGSYFIDRNPKLFPIILDFLRMGTVSLEGVPLDKLQVELDFYQISFPDEVLNVLFKDSKLVNLRYTQVVSGWFPGKKFTLVYRATTDGFAAAAFHGKCDNKGPTIVFVKSGDNLFGGYSPDHWDSATGYKSNAAAFIFTLNNQHNKPPTKFQTNGTNSTYCHVGHAITFGSGHDIYICPNANTTQSSYTNFPHGYIDTTGIGKNLLAGSYNFLVSEIEVYSVHN